jgi:4-hydroxy-3-methylbut-2-enyl diphosphate reductase
MRILRAAHLGMCFGVRDAIELAVRRSDTAPLTVLGNLVHNDAVLARLASRGIATADDPTRVATRTVMVTAHGTSYYFVRLMNSRGSSRVITFEVMGRG